MRSILGRSNWLAAIILALATVVSNPAIAQKWPKAEMDAYARSFAGRTYVMKLGGLGNTLVYAAPNHSAYIVRSLDSKVVRGQWEISYSMSNRSVIACIRRSSVKQCVTKSVISRFPYRRGDLFALAQRRGLNGALPINFGLAEAARAAR
ncbi:hypothetical protein [Fulvimarina sp. MAC3]|uniref:hypothetical protein n=1 Tax=Fulvimarina sp. MAC3 TaxID=3148887 RepID=UPI0031FD45A5